MCLDKLENFEVTQSYGWQVFYVNPEGLLNSRFHGDRSIPVGKWQRDKFRIFDRLIYIDENGEYKKGFHIFLNEDDARIYCPSLEAYCVKKVRFKRVVARGFQIIVGEGQKRWAKVVICHKRFVEPDREEKDGKRT